VRFYFDPKHVAVTWITARCEGKTIAAVNGLPWVTATWARYPEGKQDGMEAELPVEKEAA
jgi:hypothetical protein